MRLTNTFQRFASTFTAVLIGLACWVEPAAGQCCGGAQNLVTDSLGGRFRVEATSLTGTGHTAHGPYKFRFRTLRVGADGETEEIGVFDRAWNTEKHFTMTVGVSPTGNGFALSSAFEAKILFFAPDGTILATIEENDPSIVCACQDNTPVNLTVTGRTPFGFRRTRLWLPLLHVTGPETEWVSEKQPNVIVKENIGFKTVQPEEVRWVAQMLKWRPDQGEREAGRVKELIEQADETGLIELGLSALPLVEANLALKEQIPLRRVQREIIRRLCGHRDAWRNLDLLLAFGEHPNKSLRDCAQEQLQALLPDGEPTAEWVRQNRGQLKWDAELNAYRT